MRPRPTSRRRNNDWIERGTSCRSRCSGARYVTGVAHSIVGGSAWEPTPWRAVQRAAAEPVSGSEIAATAGWAVTAGQEL
jgi:hypothetical protein